MNTDNGRKLRGLAILAQAGTINRIDSKTYSVKSQSGAGWYRVTEENGEWRCECPDFVNRGVVCKHCYAVSCSIALRDKAVSQNISPPVELPELGSLSCKKCGSLEVVKRGIRKNGAGQVQRFCCKVCAYRFVVNEGFLKMKSDGKIVCLALDLYFKGNSFRKIADTLSQFYGVNVEHSTIIRWLQKYVEIAKAFVDDLKPELSGIYHVDEMMVHVRKTEPIKTGSKHGKREWNYSWLWNLADHDTRFLLASRVSKRRNVEDVRAVFQDAKGKMSKRPLAIVHDGLKTYNEGFNNEFYTNYGPRIENVRSVGQRDKGLNQMVERVNNSIRDREKTFRGMDNDESAQVMADGIRINYNFIRPHMGLDGKTPAQAAELDLGLDGIRWKALIKRATEKSREH
jgi:transposase-like protein